MPRDETGDQNLERLLGRYDPEEPDPEFVLRLRSRLRIAAETRPVASPQPRRVRAASAGLAAAAFAAAVFGAATLLGHDEVELRRDGAVVWVDGVAYVPQADPPAPVATRSVAYAPQADPPAPVATRSEVARRADPAPPTDAPDGSRAADPSPTTDGEPEASDRERADAPRSTPSADASSSPPPPPAPFGTTPIPPRQGGPTAVRGALRPRPLEPPPPAPVLSPGRTLETTTRDRRALQLADGSLLYVAPETEVHVRGERHVELARGELFLEVAPRADEVFRVTAPDGREVTALGTRFGVSAVASTTRVLVSQGRVGVSGVAAPLTAGEALEVASGEVTRGPAPPATHALAWTRELRAQLRPRLVPPSRYAGGALVAVDPDGQETRLTLRRYHVDAHVEDGFARTTIDQTFFNEATRRLEGTFRFPLPADASISRLAMYVGGRLMEGGIAERKRARQVYETIVRSRRDPALLEWVDGTTFSLRVFPLEPRQETRIVLSYTQKLPTSSGRTSYRFPAGHSLPEVRAWSFRARVVGGAGWRWRSDSHDLTEAVAGQDLILRARASDVAPNTDVTLELEDPEARAPSAETAVCETDDARYLLVRHRPDIRAPRRPRRDWVVVFEASGDRDPVLARAQVELVRELLTLADPDDTFSLLAVSNRIQPIQATQTPADAGHVAAAIGRLEEVHLLGGLDLAPALEAARARARDLEAPWVLHVGAGLPVIGPRDVEDLLDALPPDVPYVGVGVGRRWSEELMRAAAARSGGHAVQVHPDQDLGWAALELLATLDGPRVLDARLETPEGRRLLSDVATLRPGDELWGVLRLEPDQPLPQEVVVAGARDGAPYRERVPLPAPTGPAGYLPRTWARLEVQRLLAEDPRGHREAVVQLAQRAWLLTPFTSLIVLESEADHRRYGIPPGRGGDWAPYPCPPQIPVVREPLLGPTGPARRQPRPLAALDDLLVRLPLRMHPAPDGWSPGGVEASLARLVSDAQSSSSALSARRTSAPDLVRVPRQPLEGEQWRGADERRLDRAETRRRTLGDSSLAGELERLEADAREALLEREAGTLREVHRQLSLEESLLTERELERDAERSLELAEAPEPRAKGIEDAARFEPDLEREPTPPSSGARPEAVDVRRLRGLAVDLPTRQLQRPARGPAPGHPTNSIFLRATRRLDQDDFFYRTVDADPDEALDELTHLDEDGGAGPAWDLSGLSAPPAPPSADPPLDVRRSLVFGLPLELGRDIQRALRHVRPPLPPLDAAADIDLLFGWPRESAGPGHETGAGMPRLTGDLLAFAPGMNVLLADAAAALDEAARPRRGHLDPAARALIERARSTSWYEVLVPPAAGRPAFVVRADGRSRFVIDRTIAGGLRERITSDGAVVHHLYPELGVGARRAWRPAHHGLLQELVPWALAAPEDMARGADVTSLDARTVAIVPHEGRRAIEELRFDAAGRLVERRWRLDGRTLLRQSYLATGEVVERDGAGAVVGRSVRPVRAAEPPPPRACAPDPDLVVLPLPVPVDGPAPTTPTERLSAAIVGRENGLRVVAEEFLLQGDRRLGLYTCLVASDASWDPRVGRAWASLAHPSVEIRPTASHPDAPLAQYLEQQLLYQVGHLQPPAGLRGAGESSFLHHLSVFRHLWARWEASKGRLQHPDAELRHLGAFAREARLPRLAWALIDRLRWSPQDPPPVLRRLAEVCAALAEDREVGERAGLEAVRLQVAAGDGSAAAERYRRLHAQARAEGRLLPLDPAVQRALASAGTDTWRAWVGEVAEDLVADGGRPDLLAVFACQVRAAGDPALGADLLDRADEASPRGGARRLVADLRLRFHVRAGADAPAVDALGAAMAADPERENDPGWHRLGAELAHRAGRRLLALEHLDRALSLEATGASPLIDLRALRDGHSRLVGEVRALVAAHRTLEQPVPHRLLALAVAAVERWRRLDPEPGYACKAAAWLLLEAGQPALAWDYLTTWVAHEGGGAGTWRSLARRLGDEGHVDAADRAWAQACLAEPTNAGYLGERITHLLRAGRGAAARPLLARLAEGPWPRRYAWEKDWPAWARRQLRR